VVSGGALTLSGGSSAFPNAQQSVLTSGRYYRVVVVLSSAVAVNSLALRVGGAASQYSGFTSAGTYTFTVLSDGADIRMIRNSGFTDTATIDNISVRELAGNHASQATAASRPTYGVVPQGGRRNLLLWSEDYSNAVWIAGTGASKSASKITNTSTTNVFVYQQVSGLPLSRFTASVDFKKDTARYAQLTLGYSTGNLRYAVLLDLDTGLFVEDANTATALTEKSYSISSVVDGWYRISISGTGAAGVGFLVVSGTNSLPVTRNADLDFTNATNGVAVNVRKADLRPASDLGNYQRVTTQYDVTEAGVPSCSYLFFDGGSDSMATGNIDFTATDKMTVWAGVRKNSDAAAGMLAELSSNWFSSTGAFAFTAPDGTGATYGLAVRGSGTVYANLLTFTAPITNVVTQLYDIAGTTVATEMVGRVNSSAVSLTNISGTGAGTGNFGNWPLYIGARAGTSLFFNGNLFGLIVRGAASTTAQITDTEQWLAPKTTFFRPVITGVPTVGVS
jgi:hypothetical protein